MEAFCFKIDSVFFPKEKVEREDAIISRGNRNIYSTSRNCANNSNQAEMH